VAYGVTPHTYSVATSPRGRKALTARRLVS
jgi:hypothetical protein